MKAEPEVLQLIALAHVPGCESLQSLFRQGLPPTQSILQLGVSALQLLLHCPRDGHLIVMALRSWSEKEATPSPRQRDILPLPLPPIGAVLQLLRMCTRTSSGLLVWDPPSSEKHRRRKLKKIIHAGAFQLWKLLVIFIVNGESSNWQGTLLPNHKSPATKAQQQSLDNIDRLVKRFIESPLEVRDGKPFEQLVLSKGLDYAGEEIVHALPVRLGEILPGLPEDGVAGSLDASSVASGDVLQWLENPEQCLLPRDQWPQPIPEARMNCSRSDWRAVAKVLVAKQILVPIPNKDIYHVHDKPLLNGIFSVEKKGDPGPGECRITRLIMNCVPSNSIQRLMVGDLPTLSSSSQWVSAFLRPSQVVLWSGDDQQGAYYALEAPDFMEAFHGVSLANPRVADRITGCPGSVFGLGGHPHGVAQRSFVVSTSTQAAWFC